jgi:oleandomycin transport system permease protein
MTSTTLPAPTSTGPRRAAPWLRHSVTLAGRAVRKMTRHPEQFFDVTLQPVLFLIIFVYVLGGAIAGSTHDYLQYVLPGIMIQTVLFSTVSIGVNLSTDVKEGVFDRFRSLPIARSAPLIGAVLAEGLRYSLTIVTSLVAGYVMGYRTTTGLPSVLLGAVLVLLFAWCLCWVTVWLGMVVREAGTVQGFGMIAMFPLTFGSSMFVRAGTMPGWLRAWVDVNPVSHLTDAVRGLLTGGSIGNDLMISIGTALAILLVFAPLAVRAYRRKV